MKSTDTTKLINKLNRETKEDKVKWNKNNRLPSSLTGSERMINDIYYTAAVNLNNIRLYKFQSRYYTDEDTYTWSEGLRMEFTDSMGNSTWEFPNDAAIHSLYETVRYKTAGVESFFNSYLSNEEEEESPQEPDFGF